mmetsp:Transcript_24971/g.68601  ORF Transcript_24971/g.68601 Transcript_24971/m.68601 type:complete len:324 (-) Transcript_24971:232-1203(-)
MQHLDQRHHLAHHAAGRQLHQPQLLPMLVDVCIALMRRHPTQLEVHAKELRETCDRTDHQPLARRIRQAQERAAVTASSTQLPALTLTRESGRLQVRALLGHLPAVCHMPGRAAGDELLVRERAPALKRLRGSVELDQGLIRRRAAGRRRPLQWWKIRLDLAHVLQQLEPLELRLLAQAQREAGSGGSSAAGGLLRRLPRLRPTEEPQPRCLLGAHGLEGVVPPPELSDALRHAVHLALQGLLINWALGWCSTHQPRRRSEHVPPPLGSPTPRALLLAKAQVANPGVLELGGGREALEHVAKKALLLQGRAEQGTRCAVVTCQ